jgi:hypothetical protein
MPSDKPEVYADASGRVTTVAKLDNSGVNGIYLTSEGKKGEAAWGTRGHWCNLSGKLGEEPVTISIFDHPANPGFPHTGMLAATGFLPPIPWDKESSATAKKS